MQPGLYGELEDKQDAEDFVADALLGGLQATREYVAEGEEPLAELVVGAAEVKGREAEGVERRG